MLLPTAPVLAFAKHGAKQQSEASASLIASRYCCNLEISGALLVVAYPQGKATIITIERSRLAAFWENHLLPRLKRFYDNQMRLAF
jgi:hypothetical protein